MSGLIARISAFFSAFSQHRDLALENLALRQQLAIFKRRHPRPRLRPTDRLRALSVGYEYHAYEYHEHHEHFGGIGKLHWWWF